MSHGAFRRTILASGLRIVSESLPHLRSVSVGAWVGTGARDEAETEAGASHFLEHLLFKGTETRSARELAATVESVGGEMNAFTTHEQTAFYVRVPDIQVERALDVLCDVVWRPAFRPDEVESERQVILEELGMRDDAPDDLVHDRLAAIVFPDHPLGREVLGSAPTVRAMTRDTIGGYHHRHYVPGNVVVAAAGNVDHDRLVEMLAARAPTANGTRPARLRPVPTRAAPLSVDERPGEQAHVALGWRGLPARDPDRYALAVLDQALGGGMASRLFQEVREERGLAYSVYSYRAGYDDAGVLAVYAGTSPERVEQTLDCIDAEVARLVRDGGLPDDELASARGSLAGGLTLGLETSASHMRRIGHAELTEGDVPTVDEIVARVEAVGPADIARVVDRVLRDRAPSLAVVGPVASARLEARVA